jgi:CBS domain-containing protein
MLVGDILCKNHARVATVRMNETVAIAAQLMRANHISALVVNDASEPKAIPRSVCLRNATSFAQLPNTARPALI